MGSNTIEVDDKEATLEWKGLHCKYYGLKHKLSKENMIKGWQNLLGW